MMHSPISSNDPLHVDCNSVASSPSSASAGSGRVKPLSCLLTLSLNGECHDLSNLCWGVRNMLDKHLPQDDKDEVLYPKRALQQLAEIDDQHTLQLWEPLPRAGAPFRRSHTADSAMKCAAKSSDNNSNKEQPQQPDSVAAKLALNSVESQVMPVPRRRGRRCTMPARPTPMVPATGSNTRPGPRPKVNYKRLYGGPQQQQQQQPDNTNHPIGSRSLGNSAQQRHITFQEQQLQRTLEEGRNSPQQHEEEDPIPSSSSSLPPPAPMEPSYPMPCPIVMDTNNDWKDVPRPSVMPPKPAVPYYSSSNSCDRSTMSAPLPSTTPTYAPAAQPPAAMVNHHNNNTPSNNNSKTVMEVAPNMFVPYIGSHETWEAIQRGSFTVTTCFACTMPLVVIDTAEFLVCPDCHTVSPLSYSGSNSNAKKQRYGVGLGIKREWCDVEQQHQQQDATRPTTTQESNNWQEPSLQVQPLPTSRSIPATPRVKKEDEKSTQSSSNGSTASGSSRQNVERRATFML